MDKYHEAKKTFNEWGTSEEGRKILSERAALISQSKATGAEELGRAIDAMEGGETDRATKATPTKRAHDAMKTPTKETPAKQRRVSVGKVTAASKEPFLDEPILEEAGKIDLVAQPRNLASRPDVCALGKSSQQLLDVLKTHNGMVNAAKHALLSA